MPFVSRRPAQPRQPRRCFMLHPLKHVRDHHNPLADTTAFASRQAPQLSRSRFAAKEIGRHSPSPKHGILAHCLYHIWVSLEAGIIRRRRGLGFGPRRGRQLDRVREGEGAKIVCRDVAVLAARKPRAVGGACRSRRNARMSELKIALSFDRNGLLWPNAVAFIRSSASQPK